MLRKFWALWANKIARLYSNPLTAKDERYIKNLSGTGISSVLYNQTIIAMVEHVKTACRLDGVIYIGWLSDHLGMNK